MPIMLVTCRGLYNQHLLSLIVCPVEANDERQHQHIHRICRLGGKACPRGGVCFLGVYLKLTFFSLFSSNMTFINRLAGLMETSMARGREKQVSYGVYIYI